jgi:hypothetical protein
MEEVVALEEAAIRKRRKTSDDYEKRRKKEEEEYQKRKKTDDAYWELLLAGESEDEENESRICFCAAASVSGTKESFFVRDRIEWSRHLDFLEREQKAFRRLYRMERHSFEKLCLLLKPHIEKDESMSKVRTGKGPITPEIALHCLLRWLAGGSYLDIRLYAGISVSSFYVVVHRCAIAILKLPELDYSFPATNEELERVANGFKDLCDHEVMDGCVGCMDGMLLPIITPASSEVGHVKSYFSGHYQEYGINLQGVCDSKCRFLFAAVAAPGGTNDITAYRKTGLSNKIENLPLGKYVIGDNAYICTEHLLTPFSGSQKKDKKNDAYNFHLSRFRIRIEMTFGRFVNKWRLFKNPVAVKLQNLGRLIICATRLHNFCINEGETVSVPDWNSDPEPIAYLPSDPEDNVVNVDGNSMLRDILVEDLYENGLVRPNYNCNRNADV